MKRPRKPRVWTATEVAAILRGSWCAYVQSTVLSPCGHCMSCFAAALLDRIPNEGVTEAESVRTVELLRRSEN